MTERRASSKTSAVEQARNGLIAVLRQLEPTSPARYNTLKVIHDSIWGTCDCEPWEASLLEHGVFQRLRGLKQTGFAHLTYPTAEHSRFQHTLGVVAAAARIFDSLAQRREYNALSPAGRSRRDQQVLFKKDVQDSTVRRWRMLLRLAALVHDTGHSVFSHSSERIFALVPPLPQVMDELATEGAKTPGAAEVIVYLMVTSEYWHETVERLWPRVRRGVPSPPSPDDWEMIGRWVMGQELDPSKKWLADIISGPLDADKLDYVFRDGYSAGIPVGYDLARLVSTVCVDPQEDPAGTPWWRLTIPVRGINALEQLVMGRLVLNSYLYHHQKCRAAEAAFERSLAREYLASSTILGRTSVWDLFALQDADAYGFAAGQKGPHAGELRLLYGRQLRVRIVEFHPPEIEPRDAAVVAGLQRLAAFSRVTNWGRYSELISIEDRISQHAKLSPGAVILHVPKNPDYADLQNLRLPGRRGSSSADPAKILAYRDWIEAYKTHRTTYRVFGPRGTESAVWEAAKSVFADEFSIQLPKTARSNH